MLGLEKQTPWRLLKMLGMRAATFVPPGAAAPASPSVVQPTASGHAGGIPAADIASVHTQLSGVAGIVARTKEAQADTMNHLGDRQALLESSLIEIRNHFLGAATRPPRSCWRRSAALWWGQGQCEWCSFWRLWLACCCGGFGSPPLTS